MNIADFHYDLSPSLIAQEPIEPRDHSKLLVVNRTARTFQHARFDGILDWLRPGDLLILNATRVFPARLRGRKQTGGKVEVLLMERLLPRAEDATWKALVRGTTRPSKLLFPDGLEAHMVERLAEGEWLLEFSGNHLHEYLHRHGEMPLPPYIKRRTPRAADVDRYQTVYAEKEGAVAAPTAGFHFTPGLLKKIQKKGVILQSIVLHVGWGTFRPVREGPIQNHRMLPEAYEVSETAAHEFNLARREQRRIVAVGTTAVRTLETICDDKGVFHAGQGRTNLFIYAGYVFKGVDALITNFHLPDSTPLLLACAFYGADPDQAFSLKPAYEEAIRHKYRFYSYGDAMFIQ